MQKIPLMQGMASVTATLCTMPRVFEKLLKSFCWDTRPVHLDALSGLLVFQRSHINACLLAGDDVLAIGIRIYNVHGRHGCVPGAEEICRISSNAFKRNIEKNVLNERKRKKRVTESLKSQVSSLVNLCFKRDGPRDTLQRKDLPSRIPLNKIHLSFSSDDSQCLALELPPRPMVFNWMYLISSSQRRSSDKVLIN